MSELTPEQWALAFDIVYEKLGGTFVALYGGEPLMYPRDGLLQIVRHLAKKRSPIRDFTLISNGLLLTEGYADDLMEAGLESWTSSVDAVSAVELGDRGVLRKTQEGIKALEMFRAKGLRDTCGIVTVTARNLGYVVETVEWLSSRGHWVGLDLLHWQRGDGEFSFSSRQDEMEDLVLRPMHLAKLAQVAEYLMQHRKELMVFPTERVLGMWKEPTISLDLTWKCTPGHSITLDADGTIGLCDDRMPTAYGEERRSLLPNGRPWSVFDFVDDADGQWERFVQWYAQDLVRCSGCFWSTHVMAVDALNDEKMRGHYVHKVLPKEL